MKPEPLMLLPAQFKTQTDYMDACLLVWRKAGRPSRQAYIFPVIRAFHEQSKSRPTQYKVWNHLMEELGLSKTRAKVYAQAYILLELCSVSRLSPLYQAWLAKNAPTFWKPFVKRDKFITEALAKVRVLEQEFISHVDERARARRTMATTETPTPGTRNPPRHTRPVTRKWLIENGFL